MRWHLSTFCLVCLSLIPLWVGCGEPIEPPADGGNPCAQGEVTFTAQENKRIFALSPLPAIPANPTNKWADDPKAAHMGQFMFFDARLSLRADDTGGKVSCATCHEPTKGWGDGRSLSTGVATLTRHSMTLWNIAYNRWYFWDGRSDTAWSQGMKPIEDSKEMASSRFYLLYLFANKLPELKKAYEGLFGPLPTEVLDKYKDIKEARPDADPEHPMQKNWDKIAEEDKTKINRFFSNIGKAFEAFQRKIISRDAPFDTFVEGLKTCDPTKAQAISESAKRGLKTFIKKDSCISCHDGPNLSDGEFHNNGLPLSPELKVPDTGRRRGLQAVIDDIFNGLGPYSDAPDDPINDRIRFLRVDNPNTFGEFKTPTLRSVATSAPYMHDGQFKGLEEVIKFYSHFGVKDTSGCIKGGRATYKLITGTGKVQDESTCKMSSPQAGLREETMLLLLLSDNEQTDLVNFLKSLTGKALPDNLTKQPTSPIQ